MQELRRVRSGVLGEKVGITSCSPVTSRRGQVQSVEFSPAAQCRSANSTLEQKRAAESHMTSSVESVEPQCC